MKTLFLIMIAAFLLGCNFLPGIGEQEDEPRDETVPEFVQNQPGNIYYVSNSGNDSNDGLTQNSSWATLSKLNSMMFSFQPGDTILLNRGDVFRGHLEPMAGDEGNWIQYSSYGTGAKPQIIGSIQLVESSDWELHSGNLYKTTADLSNDVGGVFFNSIDSNGYYEDFGERKWNLSDLLFDRDFYFDPTGENNRLYLYSSGGAPDTIYSNIEASLNVHLVDISQKEYILFEGIHFNKGGGHGFSGDRGQYLIIKGCDFSYMGGGFLYYDSENGRNVRYGNGIEFWTDANNILVEANRFWEIYDTAVTNQGHSRTSAQYHIYYLNNIIWNCGLASFELWNRDSSSEMSDIYFINNTSINPGYGWGGAEHREDKNSYHIASYSNTSSGDTLVIKNNIFYTLAPPPGAEYHLFFFDENIGGTGYTKYIIDNNLWYISSNPTWAVSTSEIYSSFIEWQGINHQSQNGITEDPLFSDYSNGDFSLLAGSPAIDAGENLFREEDFYGNPNSGNMNFPDMGAIEFQIN
ncbi:MAG: hypothetical protein JEY99_11125 [Spirochaetales bacterium]|nr:hypothetical protein [Spirochaetales bacterium]